MVSQSPDLHNGPGHTPVREAAVVQTRVAARCRPRPAAVVASPGSRSGCIRGRCREQLDGEFRNALEIEIFDVHAWNPPFDT